MRHALILSIALTALAGAAEAQSRPPANGQAAGLRYLTWAGKAEPATPTRDAPAPSAAPLRPATRTAPPRVIPHAGGMASAPAPAPAPRGLTPANAWMRPVASAPASAPAAAPAPAPEPAPPVPAPVRHATPEAAPAPVQAQPSAPPANDPMAPRRDAAIFRMGSDAPPPVAAAAAPGQQAAAYGPGGRYYSVHRQNGRQPDAVAMPAPVYLDALPVEMERAPQSDDLAEPPAAPTVLRDNNGRVRPAPPAPGEDVQ